MIFFFRNKMPPDPWHCQEKERKKEKRV